MKHLKSFFMLGIIVLAILCSSFVGQQGKPKKYLTLNLLMTGMTEFKLVIITEDGKVEEVPTEKFKVSNNLENEKIKTMTINDISSKGYELVFANSTQYIFEKK